MTAPSLRHLAKLDLPALGPALQNGLRWWSRELQPLVPAALARRLQPPRPVARLTGDGVRWSRLDQGRSHPADAPALPTQALLALGGDEVLETELDLPATLTPEDVERLLALELDRYTPFSAAAALYAVRPASAASGPHRRYHLAVLPRGQAEALTTRATEAGVRPAGFVLLDADGRPGQVLPPLPAKPEGLLQRLRRQGWAWGAALLVLINLLLLLGRDVQSLAELEAAVESQRALASRAAALRRQVAAEEERRQELLAAKTAGDPLALLDAVAAALPDGAWVLRLDWDPAARTLHLVGEADPTIDVLALLEATPQLEDARPAAAPPAVTTGRRPFDITTRVATGSRP